MALEQATAALTSAQAAYDAAVQGATPQQLAVAKAQIDVAKAQVAVAASQVPGPRPASRRPRPGWRCPGQPRPARRPARRPRNGPWPTRPIKSAQAALAAAEAQIQQVRVTAPFAGQVGAVAVRPGELAVPGQPVLTLGDMCAVPVQTTDLRETDVARLQIGMPVEATFDALPGRTFTGTIARIAPMSSAEKGSTNYTVIIEVAELDASLRWGMTAFVNIGVGK